MVEQDEGEGAAGGSREKLQGGPRHEQFVRGVSGGRTEARGRRGERGGVGPARGGRVGEEAAVGGGEAAREGHRGGEELGE
jgi:hypothetical protein